MTAPARRTATAGAWRQAGPCALVFAVLALPGAAHAQFAGTLGVDSVNRYRGMGTNDVGPVLRASAMADATAGLLSGAYGGVSGLWRTRDAGFASADAMLGWSGRLDAIPGLETLAPDWGWDAGVHRTHYAKNGRNDFAEAMVGVLGPGWALRTWFAPHYFGGSTRTFYTELDANHAFDERWHAFGHAGWLHYGPTDMYSTHIPDRADTLVGIGYTLSAWDIRLARDGIVAGAPRSDFDARRRRAAWILGASVAF